MRVCFLELFKNVSYGEADAVLTGFPHTLLGDHVLSMRCAIATKSGVRHFYRLDPGILR